MSDTKQVILIRKDLKMRRGKEIAQGAHASMEFLVSHLRQTQDHQVSLSLDKTTIDWLQQGTPKICLQANSEEELHDRYNAALALGLKSYLIQDSGRTEFNGVPTYTACCIGPDLSDSINKVTGDLKLY